MTPLAHRIVKELTLPLKRRTMNDECNVLAHIDGIHCFELSATWHLVNDLAEKQYNKSIEGGLWKEKLVVENTLAFLPAEKTWIEWKEPGSKIRNAVLLTQTGGIEENGGLALCTVCYGRPDSDFGSFLEFALPMGKSSQLLGQMRVEENNKHFSPRAQISLMFDIYAALALINTPKIIGREQFMPNRGLERKLTQAFGVGKFPLHAWTEIKLHISKPIEIDDGEPHEAHLTGRRALHFCRKHIRIRLGRLEYVSAHWRGDPALGIKRSRYSVVP